MMNVEKFREFEKLLVMYAEAELSLRRVTERRGEALQRVAEFVNDHAAESVGTFVGISASTDTVVREFVGWISGDIPALHSVSVPDLADSLERFRKARGRALSADLPMPGFDILGFHDRPEGYVVPSVSGWEATAQACGFEGVTEALGYLLTQQQQREATKILNGESPPPLTTMSGLDTLTDAPDATPFPLPDFIPPPPPAQVLAPPVLHDPDAPAPQDRCLCKVCNDERARLRTLRRPPQVA